MRFIPRVLRLLTVLFFFILLFSDCQRDPIDANLYYKKPDLHVINNNAYDWTDIIIKVKIIIGPFSKRTFIYNMKNLVSGKDTIFNLDNLAKASIYDKNKQIPKEYKIRLSIISFQGTFTKDLNIKVNL